jgi:hypothetical protein
MKGELLNRLLGHNLVSVKTSCLPHYLDKELMSWKFFSNRNRFFCKVLFFGVKQNFLARIEVPSQTCVVGPSIKWFKILMTSGLLNVHIQSIIEVCCKTLLQSWHSLKQGGSPNAGVVVVNSEVVGMYGSWTKIFTLRLMMNVALQKLAICWRLSVWSWMNCVKSFFN